MFFCILLLSERYWQGYLAKPVVKNLEQFSVLYGIEVVTQYA